MNKKMFDMIIKFSNKTADLFLELDKIHGDEKATEMTEELDKLVTEYLGFDRWQDLDDLFEDENLMYLTKEYEGVPKYLKLYIVHEYDNGMVACVSTAESYHLVPKDYLAKFEG